MCYKAFSQAFRAIREYSLLANVSLLDISHSFLAVGVTRIEHIANEVGQLFKSLGPLEELAIDCCDIRPYLAPFLDLPEFRDLERPFVFPPIQELTISHPLHPPREVCAAAIVEFAKSQHASEIPFIYVTVCMENTPAGMVERLRPWVGQAHCEEKVYRGDPGTM